MRRGHAGKVDLNQSEIVDALRKAGYSVLSLASIGAGCPDLLVASSRGNVLLEIKRPGEKLNRLQMLWHARWKGPTAVAESAEQALTALEG